MAVVVGNPVVIELTLDEFGTALTGKAAILNPIAAPTLDGFRYVRHKPGGTFSTVVPAANPWAEDGTTGIYRATVTATAVEGTYSAVVVYSESGHVSQTFQWSEQVVTAAQADPASVIQPDIASLQTDINTANTTLGSLDLGPITTTLDDLTTAVGNLQDTLETDPDIPALIASVSAAQTSISGVQTTLDGLSDELEDLLAFETTLDSVHTKIDIIDNVVDAIATSATSLIGDTSDLSDEVALVKIDTNALVILVGDIDDTIGEINTTVDGIETEVDDISGRLTDTRLARLDQLERPRWLSVSTGEGAVVNENVGTFYVGKTIRFTILGLLDTDQEPMVDPDVTFVVRDPLGEAQNPDTKGSDPEFYAEFTPETPGNHTLIASATAGDVSWKEVFSFFVEAL